MPSHGQFALARPVYRGDAVKLAPRGSVEHGRAQLLYAGG